MAVTGIGYGRTFVYEAQKRVNAGDVQSAQGSATETAESRFAESIEELAKEDNTVKTPVTRGVQLTRHIEGKDKVPYGEMAEDGVIEYNGVTFVCDYEHNRLTLGDTTNKEDCINIPLSGGGSLLVNRDNIDDLSRAIGMFSPEDVKRILEALARDNKIRQMKKELDDMENGDDVDNSEEASETADVDKAAGTDASGTAGEPEEEDLSLMEQIKEKMQEIYDKLQNGDTEIKFQIGNQEFHRVEHSLIQRFIHDLSRLFHVRIIPFGTRQIRKVDNLFQKRHSGAPGRMITDSVQNVPVVDSKHPLHISGAGDRVPELRRAQVGIQ